MLSAALAAPLAQAQANPTAEQPTRLSFFAGATGTHTGLYASRNAGITAGVDIEVYHFFGFHPAIEIRGTYPVADGDSVALKNILGGIRLEKTYARRLHPYGDFLFGRGELDYQNGGLLDRTGSTFYLESLSSVWSPGGGIDLDLTRRFALKLDVQAQRYSSPITHSGSEWATAGTVGVTYRLGSRSYRSEP